MNVSLHRAITAGIMLYLCSAAVLIVMGVPSFGLFGIFLWLQYCLVHRRPPGIGCLVGLLLIVQLCAFLLIVYGSIHQSKTRRTAPTTVRDERAWPHFAVAAILAIAAGSVLIGFDVWASTKLDLIGATAHGSSEWIRDYTVRYEFTTEERQTIAALRTNSPEANTFVYLRNRPHVFKVKGTGRGPQIGFLLLVALCVWQFVAGARILRKTKAA